MPLWALATTSDDPNRHRQYVRHEKQGPEKHQWTHIYLNKNNVETDISARMMQHKVNCDNPGMLHQMHDARFLLGSSHVHHEGRAAQHATCTLENLTHRKLLGRRWSIDNAFSGLEMYFQMSTPLPLSFLCVRIKDSLVDASLCPVPEYSLGRVCILAQGESQNGNVQISPKWCNSPLLQVGRRVGGT